MNFLRLKFLAPACAALMLSGFAAGPANAAPLQKAAIDSGSAQVTLVAQRDGRWRGDRGRDRGRNWRGRDDRRYWRGDSYRPYYRPYYPPRYVYRAPPRYYYPYDDYYYPYSYGPSGYFSFSSPNLGLSFGY
jgi:hypothetical protein